jgi:hypothetical protein
MTTSKLYRVSGLGLVIGSIAFTAHVVLRSVLTAGVDPSLIVKNVLWVPINALGFIGAMSVLMGLPAMYARTAKSTGSSSLSGAVLVAVAWTFFGVFLSLYAALLMPWLADKAPSLVAADAPLPAGVLVAFLLGLSAWFVGTVLLGIPYIRGRLKPRWVGYALPASALWMVIGNLVIAPSGPATNLAVNLLSNLGPVLLLVPVAYLGVRLWSEREKKTD